MQIVVDNFNQRVTELLCSKICHDLINPVGAINNGMELLSDLGTDIQGASMTLIKDSACQDSQRLEYFRLAFGGWGGGEEATTEFGLVRQVIGTSAAENNMELSWRTKPDDTEQIEKYKGKLILGLVLLAEECVRRTAALDIFLELTADNFQTVVAVSGDRCGLHPETRTGFEQRLAAEDVTVRNVVACNCTQIAQANGLALNFSDDIPNSIEFRISN